MLQRQGQGDIAQWAADNPTDPKVAGTYLRERAGLGALMNEIGVPLEERETFLRDLKFRTEPGVRAETLASLLAHGGEPTDAQIQHVADTLAAPYAPRGPLLALPTLPTRSHGYQTRGGEVWVGDGVTLDDGRQGTTQKEGVCPVRSSCRVGAPMKGITVADQGDFDEQLAEYDATIADLSEATDIADREYLAWALLSRGDALYRVGRRKEALVSFEEVVTRLGNDPEVELRLRVATALSYSVTALIALKRPDDGIAACDQLLDRFADDPDPGFSSHVSFALVEKGIALTKLERDEEAVEALTQAITRFRDASEPRLRGHVASALYNLEIALRRLGRHEEAVGAIDEYAALVSNWEDPDMPDRLAASLDAKGEHLAALGRPDEALAAFREVVTRYGDTDDPRLRVRVVYALLHAIVTLWRLDRDEQALDVCDELLARFAADDEPAVHTAVVGALVRKGAILALHGRTEEAAPIFEEITSLQTDDGSRLLLNFEPDEAERLERAFATLSESEADADTASDTDGLLTFEDASGNLHGIEVVDFRRVESDLSAFD